MGFKRAQSSVELLVLIGLMFLVFLGAFSAIRSHLRDIRQESDQSLLIETAEFLGNEVGLAVEAEPGYYRQFELPSRFGSAYYEILVLRAPEGNFTEIVLRFVNSSIDFEKTIFAPPAVEGSVIIDPDAASTTVTIKKDAYRITINST